MKFVLSYSSVLFAAVMGALEFPNYCTAKNSVEVNVPGRLQEKSKIKNVRGVAHVAQAAITELNSHDDMEARKLQATTDILNGISYMGFSGANGSETNFALRNVLAGEIVACTASAGTGVLRMAVKIGDGTQLDPDCESTQTGNKAYCLAGPTVTSTNVTINLVGVGDYTDGSVACSYPTSVPGLQHAVPLTALSGAASSLAYFTVRNVPSGKAVTCTTSGGSGDVILNMKSRYLSQITLYPECTTSTGSCTVGSFLTTTDVFINLSSPTGYTGKTLTCFVRSEVPTWAPTNSPTKYPTKKTTLSPTKKTTGKPTPPTKKPTRKPTQPTPGPTRKPTKPTPGPTKKPTNPTSGPTKKPTKPTPGPTKKPTKPTPSPTGKATRKPTVPTGKPTRKPTVPTGKPTQKPTVPTGKPTRKPTVPTRIPTKKPSPPTNSPTKKPTFTKIPTLTKKPTFTKKPTRTPTQRPL